MRKSRNNQFVTIRVEGAILPVDLLQRVSDGDKSLGGLNSADYHLIESEKLNEATNRSWNRMLGAWAAFKTGLTKLPDSDPKTSLTRERWLLPLFQELGYGRLTTSRAIEISGKSFAVSHLWGNTPIHLVGSAIDLDTRTEGVAGAARMTPHGLVQELLNRSDDYLWGFVSNGLRLRILRDNSSLTRQAFVEFDLEAMMEGEAYSDFVLLWLLCHQSRVEAEKTEECWLEKWSKAAHEQGTRALDQLRNGVTSAIAALGSGFITHSANRELRENLRSGSLDKQDYYRQLLRLVYRLLFIFVAEDRDLLFAPDTERKIRERYTKYYSTSRVRRLAGRKRGTKHPDLYYGLRVVMQKLGSDDGCPELGLPALGSFLFSTEAIADIEGCEIANLDFMNAIRALAYTLENSALRPVDYKNLGSEELGSVYESLLELHPELNLDAGVFELRMAAGNERKTTGSYYTPSGLIQCLLDSALDPVLDEAVKKPDPEKALLALKVCDPACGSGHFLIAAAHRIAKRVAMVRTGEIEPSPDAVRAALRQVISKCIYGVDINPMSVELCKVALWMEAIDPGKPLSFLDHHIQCGNSLVGTTPRLLSEGIPDDAFSPIEGDDKAVCTEYKKRNKKERDGQQSMFGHDLQPWEQLGNLSTAMMSIDSVDDGSIEAEHIKQERYEQLVHSTDYEYGKLLADTWCAAFMWKKTRQFDYPITEELFRRIERTPHWCPDWMKKEVQRLAEHHRFFHWHLAFPNVFRVPGKDEEPENQQTGWIAGFDCVLGNPPWEVVQVEEKQFFAQRDPAIAKLSGDSRKMAIKRLKQDNPSLDRAFAETKDNADRQSRFLRQGGLYPLVSIGKLNTYAVFAELAYRLVRIQGRAGIVVPTGIATDESNRMFFAELVRTNRLVSMLGFVNERFLFSPPVEHYVTFGLLTILGQRVKSQEMEFCWLAQTVDESNDPLRRVNLEAADLQLLNPNTLNCPVFRTNVDYLLVRSIYERVPVLDGDIDSHSPWQITLRQGLFNMTSDSGLFLRNGADGLLRLYESKMFHQYDHRYGDYASRGNERGFIALPEASIMHYQDARHRVDPYYWVAQDDVDSRMPEHWTRHWLIATRNMARNTDIRTVIASILPKCGLGHSASLLFLSSAASRDACLFIGNLNSLVLDYVSRVKLGGPNLNFFVLKQLPILPPLCVGSLKHDMAAPRILELIYTAWDIKAFADDVWKEADDVLREAIVRQWEENRAATGGHEWDPPEWTKIDEDGMKLPPFKWDEDRRAMLRAELDAYYAKLYGLNRKQLRYILDPHGLSKKELEDILDPWEDPTCSGPHHMPAEPDLDFPGETFRVLKNKEEKQFGEYRTRRLVIEAWERLHAQGLMPDAYAAAASEPHEQSIAASAKPIVITDDDQVFPWDGRERFVYDCIPQLVELRSGKNFSFYRFAAIIASRPDHLRELLNLSGNRQSLADLAKLPVVDRFPADQRIRPNEILRVLQRNGIVGVRGEETFLLASVTPPDDDRRRLLELALEATDVFYDEMDSAIVNPGIQQVQRSVELTLVA